MKRDTKSVENFQTLCSQFKRAYFVWFSSSTSFAYDIALKPCRNTQRYQIPKVLSNSKYERTTCSTRIFCARFSFDFSLSSRHFPSRGNQIERISFEGVFSLSPPWVLMKFNFVRFIQSMVFRCRDRKTEREAEEPVKTVNEYQDIADRVFAFSDWHFWSSLCVQTKNYFSF